jgi:hypothetical protein
MKTPASMPISLDVGRVSFLFGIWGFRFIIGDSRLPSGNVSKEGYEKRLSSWKGKLLSLGRRLILINSVLTNMVLYMISFFLLPKGVLHRLDYYRSRFFWQGDSEKKKYQLVIRLLCITILYHNLLLFIDIFPI